MTQFGWPHFFTRAMTNPCSSEPILVLTHYLCSRVSWSKDLGLRPFSLAATNLKKSSWLEMGHKSGCSFADPLCSHSYPTCFHSFIFSPHPALISVHLARVFTRLTVWDGSTAFSHQLCHGVHVVQNTVVPFCSPVVLCSTT